MLSQLPMKWKLTLGVAVFVLIVGVMLGYGFLSISNETDDRFIEACEDRASANAKAIQSEIPFEVAAQMVEEIQQKITETAKQYKNIHAITVLNKDQSVLARFGQDIDVMKLIEGMDLEKPNSEKEREFIIATVPISVVTDLENTANENIGYLLYVESLAEYYQFKRKRTVQGVSLALLGIVVLMVAAYLIGSSTAKPLLNLVDAAQRIAAGDLVNVEVKAQGSLEARRLATSIKSMASALQTQAVAIKNLTNDISSALPPVNRPRQ
jgi:nitrogen fixation/metabolism regulation signal transduction histidine kinase